MRQIERSTIVLALLLVGCAAPGIATTSAARDPAAGVLAERDECRRRAAAMIEGDQAMRRDPAPGDWSGPGTQPAAAIATGDPCEPGAAYVDPETAERKAVVGVERARRFVERGEVAEAIDALVPALRAGREADRGAREVAEAIEAALVRAHGPAPGGEGAPICSIISEPSAAPRYLIATGPRARLICRTDSDEALTARLMIEPGRYASVAAPSSRELGAVTLSMTRPSQAQSLIDVAVPLKRSARERSARHRIFWFSEEP